MSELALDLTSPTSNRRLQFSSKRYQPYTPVSLVDPQDSGPTLSRNRPDSGLTSTDDDDRMSATDVRYGPMVEPISPCSPSFNPTQMNIRYQECYENEQGSAGVDHHGNSHVTTAADVKLRKLPSGRQVDSNALVVNEDEDDDDEVRMTWLPAAVRPRSDDSGKMAGDGQPEKGREEMSSVECSNIGGGKLPDVPVVRAKQNSGVKETTWRDRYGRPIKVIENDDDDDDDDDYSSIYNSPSNIVVISGSGLTLPTGSGRSGITERPVSVNGDDAGEEKSTNSEIEKEAAAAAKFYEYTQCLTEGRRSKPMSPCHSKQAKTIPAPPLIGGIPYHFRTPSVDQFHGLGYQTNETGKSHHLLGNEDRDRGSDADGNYSDRRCPSVNEVAKSLLKPPHPTALLGGIPFPVNQQQLQRVPFPLQNAGFRQQAIDRLSLISNRHFPQPSVSAANMSDSDERKSPSSPVSPPPPSQTLSANAQSVSTSGLVSGGGGGWLQRTPAAAPPILDAELIMKMMLKMAGPTHSTTVLGSSRTRQPNINNNNNNSSSINGGSNHDQNELQQRTSVISDKDEAYRERRRKNNEAAKRSRDFRRQKERSIAQRAEELKEENLQLKAQISILIGEVQQLQSMLASLRN